MKDSSILEESLFIGLKKEGDLVHLCLDGLHKVSKRLEKRIVLRGKRKKGMTSEAGESMIATAKKETRKDHSRQKKTNMETRKMR